MVGAFGRFAAVHFPSNQIKADQGSIWVARPLPSRFPMKNPPSYFNLSSCNTGLYNCRVL
jgi:hypothetical protein